MRIREDGWVRDEGCLNISRDMLGYFYADTGGIR